MDPLAAALFGALAGAFYAISGYLKNAAKKEEFKADKFLKTLILGSIIGAIEVSQGIPPSQAEILLANAGIVAIVENLAKAIANKLGL